MGSTSCVEDEVRHGIVAPAPCPESSRAVELLESLRRQLPGGGQRREGQLKMAQAVESVLDAGGVLAVNAPTGVGKSLGYSSAVVAHCGDGPVVIATASIALQDQLCTKDLPFVARHADGPPMSWAVLKGRSNYLCRAALSDTVKGGAAGVDQLELAEPDAPRDGEETPLVGLTRVVEWAERTQTGDRAELDFEPSPALWDAVSMTSEGCPGARTCPFGTSCFAEQAITEAREADVIVTNIHLYALNVATFGAILPDHDVLVVDEAHEIESVFSSVLGSEVRPGQLYALGRLLRGLVQETGNADDRVTGRIMSAAGALESALQGFDTDQRLPGGIRSVPQLADVADEIGVALAAARTLLERLPRETTEKALSRIARVRGAISGIQEGLSGVAARSDETVVWVEGGKKIRSAPLDISSILRRWFWARANGGMDDAGEDDRLPPRAIVLASATLPPGLPRRLGAARPVELSVDSPFDHRANALLYVPKLPDPRSAADEWRAALIEELATLITAAGGRTLALFTSFAGMNEAAATLEAVLPYPILVQGSLPKRALLASFAEEEAACLFGTRSFFQGVDIPGRSLSLVALDRLPFPRPDDPLVAARCDAAGNTGFRRVMIPLTATALTQAAGRLIRTGSDRGVVAVFDPRLAEAKYRADFLNALPPMRRTRTRSDVERFLAIVTEEAGREPGNHAA